MRKPQYLLRLREPMAAAQSTIEIKDQEMLDKTLDYIHQNAIVACFVTKPENWKYSSARDFCGMKGLVELSYNKYSIAQVCSAQAGLHPAPRKGLRIFFTDIKLIELSFNHGIQGTSGPCAKKRVPIKNTLSINRGIIALLTGLLFPQPDIPLYANSHT